MVTQVCESSMARMWNNNLASSISLLKNYSTPKTEKSRVYQYNSRTSRYQILDPSVLCCDGLPVHIFGERRMRQCMPQQLSLRSNWSRVSKRFNLVNLSVWDYISIIILKIICNIRKHDCWTVAESQFSQKQSQGSRLCYEWQKTSEVPPILLGYDSLQLGEQLFPWRDNPNWKTKLWSPARFLLSFVLTMKQRISIDYKIKQTKGLLSLVSSLILVHRIALACI